MSDELISIGEAAEMLGVSISTLRRWDENGRFPAIESQGGHRRFQIQDRNLPTRYFSFGTRLGSEQHRNSV